MQFKENILYSALIIRCFFGDNGEHFEKFVIFQAQLQVLMLYSIYN